MKFKPMLCLLFSGLMMGCVDKERPGDDLLNAQTIMDVTSEGVHLYRRITKMFPTNEATLSSDLAQTGINIQLTPLWNPCFDCWGTQIKYHYSNDVAVLISAGPDKIFGSSDDIMRIVKWRGDNSPLSGYEKVLNDNRKLSTGPRINIRQMK
jgi:hypothetical protein